MAQGADKPLRRGSTWMFQWLGGQGVPIRNLSLSYCLGVGSCEIADIEPFGNRRLRGWASRILRGDPPLECREVGVDQTLHFVVPVGTSRNDSLEHIGSFQLQQGLSYFLLLLIRKGIVVYSPVLMTTWGQFWMVLNTSTL